MRPRFRRFGKSLLELALPPLERLAGFRTARGDYLPNRIKMLMGNYEAAETGLMKQFLKPGQTIVDVGANIGYLARLFARATGPAGKVLALEPNPIIFPLLERNLAKFKQVSVYNLGLAAASAEMPLFLAGRDYSVASFASGYPATHVNYQENGKLGSIAAKLVVGDEFLAKIGVNRIDILKVDVEGWELNVLNGLERTIAASSNTTVFCEFNPAAQEFANSRKEELPNWFLDRQFDISYLRNGQLCPISRSSIDGLINELKPDRFVTILAVRR